MGFVVGLFLWLQAMDKTNLSNTSKKEGQVFKEVKQHHDIGFQETDNRAVGKNRIGTISFNEADELFRSYIDENNWPYDALLFDPRIFTFIFEKTSRLISNKPKGKLIPREGSDSLGARINNELLSYEWDAANQGGTMLSKWSLMDINTRKYGSSFAVCKWRYEVDGDGKTVFDGPEMQVLNNRDVAHDLSATSIENCNWFQARQYVTVQELQRVNDQSRSKPIYKNLDRLKYAVRAEQEQSGGGDSRSVNWLSRNRAIAGLELDPVGKDDTFKTIEIVTEYRRDRWITFAPKHGVILRDIPNPYKNNEIPVVMLRYYAIDDDLYGLSEIEPIKGLQKAINAILCQYVDEINQKLYSPIAIGPGVRQHTLEWGKGARWIMNNPLTDFRLVESRSNAAQYFNNTYSVLVAAMMNALGESSLGVSNVQPYQKDKTATEVKALQLQRNSRDQYNQIFLAEAIKRQYMLWHSMNQVLLFADPATLYYPIRVSGGDVLKYFEDMGYGSYDVTPEKAMEAAGQNQKALDFMQKLQADPDAAAFLEQNPDIEAQITSGAISEDYKAPKYPIKFNQNGEESVVTKMMPHEGGKSAQLFIEPADVKGTYDFVVDVESMTAAYDEERKQARQAAVSLIVTNPQVSQMLAMEQWKPKFKELFVTWLEDLGFSDSERFFEKVQAGAGGQDPMAAAAGAMGKAAAGGDIASILGGAAPGGIPGGAEPNAGGEAPQASPFSNGGANAGLGPISPKSFTAAMEGGQ